MRRVRSLAVACVWWMAKLAQLELELAPISEIFDVIHTHTHTHTYTKTGLFSCWIHAGACRYWMRLELNQAPFIWGRQARQLEQQCVPQTSWPTMNEDHLSDSLIYSRCWSFHQSLLAQKWLNRKASASLSWRARAKQICHHHDGEPVVMMAHFWADMAAQSSSARVWVCVCLRERELTTMKFAVREILPETDPFNEHAKQAELAGNWRAPLPRRVAWSSWGLLELEREREHHQLVPKELHKRARDEPLKGCFKPLCWVGLERVATFARACVRLN